MSLTVPTIEVTLLLTNTTLNYTLHNLICLQILFVVNRALFTKTTE